MSKWRVNINGSFFRRDGTYEISVTNQPNLSWGWHSLYKQIVHKGINRRRNDSYNETNPHVIVVQPITAKHYAHDLAEYKRALKMAAAYAKALNALDRQ